MVDDNKIIFDHLIEELNQHITSFKSKRNFNRSGAFWLSTSIAMLSAFTTISIGAKEIYQYKFLAIIALSLSSFATVTSAFESFYGFRSRWIQTNGILMELYELKSDIIFEKLTKKDLDIESLVRYKKQLQSMLNKTNSEWNKLRLEDGK